MDNRQEKFIIPLVFYPENKKQIVEAIKEIQMLYANKKDIPFKKLKWLSGELYSPIMADDYENPIPFLEDLLSRAEVHFERWKPDFNATAPEQERFKDRIVSHPSGTRKFNVWYGDNTFRDYFIRTITDLLFMPFWTMGAKQRIEIMTLAYWSTIDFTVFQVKMSETKAMALTGYLANELSLFPEKYTRDESKKSQAEFDDYLRSKAYDLVIRKPKRRKQRIDKPKG